MSYFFEENGCVYRLTCFFSKKFAFWLQKMVLFRGKTSDDVLIFRRKSTSPDNSLGIRDKNH